jgi:hypothetical protein
MAQVGLELIGRESPPCYKGMLPSSFYVASITLVPKADKDTTKNKDID